MNFKKQQIIFSYGSAYVLEAVAFGNDCEMI